MILVTRLNGPQFALNPDLVERADHTPDTIVTLVDGTKYVIAESVDEFIQLVRWYRAGVLADAQRLSEGPEWAPRTTSEATPRRTTSEATPIRSASEATPIRSASEATPIRSASEAAPRTGSREHGTATVVPLHPRER